MFNTMTVRVSGLVGRIESSMFLFPVELILWTGRDQLQPGWWITLGYESLLDSLW